MKVFRQNVIPGVKAKDRHCSYSRFARCGLVQGLPLFLAYSGIYVMESSLRNCFTYLLQKEYYDTGFWRDGDSLALFLAACSLPWISQCPGIH